VPVADVADLLGDDEKTVRAHYARWVPERQARLTKILKDASTNARFAPLFSTRLESHSLRHIESTLSRAYVSLGLAGLTGGDYRSRIEVARASDAAGGAVRFTVTWRARLSADPQPARGRRAPSLAFVCRNAAPRAGAPLRARPSHRQHPIPNK
jgi:hypothetical protein